MKSRLSIILSLLALAGMLTMAGFMIFSNYKVSVISLDTFVGVMVALLAIVVTVVIGLQIVNAIELREKMSALEEQQKKYAEIEKLRASSDQLRNKQIYNLQAGLLGQGTDLYIVQNYYIEAFGSAHSALFYAILSDQKNQLNRINQLKNIVLLISNKPIAEFSILAQQIRFETEEIRKTESYRNCLSSAYEQVMQEFWQKMSKLGLN